MQVLKTVERTTDARELSRENWPSWASRSTHFNRILAFSIPADSNLQSLSPYTGILTALLTERIDLKDDPRKYNYNIYLIAQTTDGHLYQSPPIKTSDPAHHSSAPSTWFDKLGSPI